MAIELVNVYSDLYSHFKDLLNTQIIITPREYGMRYRKHNKPLKRR